MNTIFIGKNNDLTVEDIYLVATKKAKVVLDKRSRAAMKRSRSVIEKSIDSRANIYGVTTQFGGDSYLIDEKLFSENRQKYRDSLRQRQMNLIKSHNCGLGEIVSSEITRAAMLLRAHSLALGISGVRPVIVDRIIECLNKDITPLIRRYGSVGASGDLIPLASLASLLVGEGECRYRGKFMKTEKAFKLAGVKKIVFEAKEGLSVINGTSFMTAIASLAVYDLRNTFMAALSGIGISLESLLIIRGAYNSFIHRAKRHNGQKVIARFFRNFWEGSKLVDNKGLQDFYSLRAVPQGFGPFYENFKNAAIWIENEANSANDNPIVFDKEQKIYHTANFMGYYITGACDFLKIDIAQASSWIHAIISNLLHPRKNKGLPANLINDPINHTGFKSAQLLAASIAVENRKLSLPLQAVMIPTEGDNQDVNSLGTHAAFDLMKSVENFRLLSSILLVLGAQALELRGIERAGRYSSKIFKIIRKNSLFLTKDRTTRDDFEKVANIVKKGDLSLFNNFFNDF